MSASVSSPSAGGIAQWLDRQAPRLMVLPAVVILLCFSIFPLIASGLMSLSRFSLAAGGYNIRFTGFSNFKKILFGSEQFHLIGTLAPLSALDWVIWGLVAALLLRWLWRALRAGAGFFGMVGRGLTAVTLFGVIWITLSVLGSSGGPGSLITTLFYVVAGVSIQFAIGLVLALLCAGPIRHRNLFRVIFFVPLMVTPVGIAYMFRMLADMSKGPLEPIWTLFGLSEFSWAADPWIARWVVLTGETWQWVPFIFIIMLAAIESQSRDQVEAAKLDGASGWQVFRDITWPGIAPVAATVILIRAIEAFKIIDFPNVLTNGGPGIATESLTLHSFIAWRTQQLGQSAAIGYILLFIAMLSCMSFFNFVAKGTRAHEREAR